jgi:hypothetical protein
LEDTTCINSEGLVLHADVGYSPSLDFSIPGTKVEKGHFAEASLTSSMGVVAVERREDSSWKIVGMVLGMRLHLDF